jgi:hypothetical protein
MVVLAVTWMAKAGREAEVAACLRSSRASHAKSPAALYIRSIASNGATPLLHL